MLTIEEIKNKAIEIVGTQLGIPKGIKEKLSADTLFVSDLGMDNLDITEFLMAIEETFKMGIPEIDHNQEIAQFQTIGDVVKYIDLQQRINPDFGAEPRPINKDEAISLAKSCLQTYFLAVSQGANENEALKQVVHKQFSSLADEVMEEDAFKRFFLGITDDSIVPLIVMIHMHKNNYYKWPSCPAHSFLAEFTNEALIMYETMKREYERVKQGIYKYEGGSGESIEEAIVIKGTNDTKEGVRLEYDYISNIYGGEDIDWKCKMQSLIEDKEKVYDRIEIILKNGEKKEFYFDITEFYGKGEPHTTIRKILEQSETFPNTKVKKFGKTEQKLLEKWKNEGLDVSKLEALDPDKLSPKQIEREFQAFSQAVASKQKWPLISMGTKNNKSDDAETYYGLGIAYAQSGDYEKAIESYKQAIRIKPDDAVAHSFLGAAYAESGDYEKAIESYKQAIRIKPDFAEAHFVLGAAYAKSGDYEKAIESHKQAIRIKPDFAEAHYNLGFAYVKTGDYEKAIESYKQVIRIKPNYAEAHCGLGLAYTESGDYEKTIESYKEAIRIKPDDAAAHCGLGLAYEKSGDAQKTIESFKQAIRIKPDLAEAHNILGYAYIAVDDRSSALEEYRILEKLDKELANKLFNLINGSTNNNAGFTKTIEKKVDEEWKQKAAEEKKHLSEEKIKDMTDIFSNFSRCPKCGFLKSTNGDCECRDDDVYCGRKGLVLKNRSQVKNEPTNDNTKSSIIKVNSSYSSCAYLDIETTGFSPSSGDITVIGIYLEKGEKKEFISLVDNNISSARLREIFKGVDLLYTYNGSFDLSFIQTKLGLDLTRYCKHIDLMKECHERGIYGGLKETERKLGIDRKIDLSGREAVTLWYKYKYEGNKEALNTLLEYNKEDAVNLSQIKRKLAAMRPNAEIPKHQEGYEGRAMNYGVGRLHDAETPKYQKDYSPTKYVSESKRSYDTDITTLKHTRVASSPQKELQQDVKPKMWADEHPVADTVYGCLIVIGIIILVTLLMALLK